MNPLVLLTDVLEHLFGRRRSPTSVQAAPPFLGLRDQATSPTSAQATSSAIDKKVVSQGSRGIVNRYMAENGTARLAGRDMLNEY